MILRHKVYIFSAKLLTDGMPEWKTVGDTLEKTIQAITDNLAKCQVQDLHAAKVNCLDNLAKFLEFLVDTAKQYRLNLSEFTD